MHKFILILFVFFSHSVAQSSWYEKESEHFKIIYKPEHSFLTEHILTSAEKSLAVLMEVFDYLPEEKIIINTYDVNDYGFASATTVPENYIRLEIEPFEPGYENIPYNDRFQWILSHELVHIVLNDQSSDYEKISRAVFAKVSPEQIQPMTVLYSLLSNYSRYTARWHQESSAVFMETWMSGGFGRISGSFDEMYFRSMVFEKREFPSPVKLDSKISHNSFLLESLFYTYGGRFAAYLADKYGSEKLFRWYKVDKSAFYPSLNTKFKNSFGSCLGDEWELFIESEKKFQEKNIDIIKSSPVTEVKHKTGPSGWITDPYVTPDHKVIFGIHSPHKLASVVKLDPYTSEFEEIATLPSPSIYQVSSVAYDSSNGFLFYTTNNNQLYRDVWVVDANSGDKKELFPDLRIGQMSVSPRQGDLWGIQHADGKTTLIYSPFPYKEIRSVYSLNIPDEIIQVSVNADGGNIAAVIHKSTGEQQLVVIDAEKLKRDKYVAVVVSESGAPENPSWSPDGEYLFWNAYVNGVSNIYRAQRTTGIVEALTNTVRGLFRPVMFNKDSLFVFEFSSEGFIPSLIANTPAERLPAINYFGQEVYYSNPGLKNLSLPENNDTAAGFGKEYSYNGISNLKLQAFIPVITGFQKQKVLGFFARVSDPLLFHDLTAEFGYSPFNENRMGPKFHLKLKYEYMKKFEAGIDHNATDFYDLFNKRKRGTIGTKIRAAYIHYWLYDNPHKIKQTTELALYTDFEYISDNLVKVTDPDFAVAQSVWNSKNLRRSIGSSDFESGDEITFTGMLFVADPKDPQYAGAVHLEWDKYFIFPFHHNSLHYKIAGGYHHRNERLQQAMFYFGGFGNREVENTDVKQYRGVFRFPGIPIYSLRTDGFMKLLLENCFPPLRFSSLSLGQHYLSHLDFSVYSQSLFLNNDAEKVWVDAGAQLSLIFKHWFNLESTFSAGIARAWTDNRSEWEWFLSYKLLKN